MICGGAFFDVLDRQTLIAVLAIEFGQGRGQHAAAAHALGHLNCLLVSALDCFSERFFHHRVEHHRRLVFVKQHELRINVRFYGKLVQQTRAQSMNRSDDSTFQRALVAQPSLSFFTRA